MSKWLQKEEEVLVITGNDKGKTGKILRKTKDRVLVQGINFRKKHMKRTSEATASQIVSRECPIHISNVRFISKAGKPVRLRVKESKEEKILFYLEGGKEIEHRKIKK